MGLGSRMSTAGKTPRKAAPKRSPVQSRADLLRRDMSALSADFRQRLNGQPNAAPSYFIEPYCTYAERQTDSPPTFHRWVAISLLAATLGNNCWVPAWGSRKCANLWIILLAPSGALRKTTALNIGSRVLEEALPGSIWPSSWSFESLIETMQADPSGLLVVRELSRFHAALSKDYAGGAKQLLVDAYDNPEREVRTTKTSGEQVLEFPAPNILAASTLEWFEKSLQRDDVASGYLARQMVISAAEEPGVWKGLVLGRSESPDDLVAHLQNVSETMRGEVDLTPVLPRYQAWLRHYEKKAQRRGFPTGLEGTISRTGANVVKLALIMQADIEPLTTISREALDRAIELVEFANEQMRALLEAGLAIDLSPDAKERLTVERIIADSKTISRTDLLKQSRLGSLVLDRHVATLREREQVAVEEKTTGGRPGTIYRWLVS